MDGEEFETETEVFAEQEQVDWWGQPTNYWGNAEETE